MKTKKYVMSDGLAFSEEKDMEKLSALAKEGWILDKFAPFGYWLKKGEPKQIIYGVDDQLKADEDYFSYFEAAGWTHICSAGNQIHIFCAPEGTKPLYTDQSSLLERYKREKRQMGRCALPLFILTLVFYLIGIIGLQDWLPEIIGTVSMFLGCLTLILLVFPGLPYLSYKNKISRLQRR